MSGVRDPDKREVDQQELFGLIFSGPPGRFAIWIRTPDDRLMNREDVELLGQLAVRAGAADYRPFPLDSVQTERVLSLSSDRYGAAEPVTCETVDRCRRILLDAGGLPESCL